MSPLCFVYTVTKVWDSGFRITEVLTLIFLERLPAWWVHYCSFGSEKASGGHLSDCLIMGTVVPTSNSTYCFRWHIFFPCSFQKLDSIITSVAIHSKTLNRMTLPRHPILTNTFMTPQMLSFLFFASWIVYSSYIDCMQGKASFWSMIILWSSRRFHCRTLMRTLLLIIDRSQRFREPCNCPWP